MQTMPAQAPLAMITLAIEQSTAVGSIALFREREPLGERSWEDAAARHRDLFQAVRGLMDEHRLTPSDVTAFAVDLGPGSFSGLRIALAAAKAFALPGNATVYGVTSGEVMATALHRETGADRIVLLGDARRERVWWAAFAGDATGRTAATTPYSLADIARLPDVLSPGVAVATPDWLRLGDRLRSLCPPGVRLVERRVVPAARTLGELAIERMARGAPSEPLSPVYLHPPVKA